MEILKQTSSTRENLGLLAVMEALKDSERITQRELALQTGLNLKRVNYCLHKLLEKGYIKFQRAKQNPDKRTYLYILTPTGLKAKSQLTYRFLKFTLDFYSKVEDKLGQCLQDFANQGFKKILLYGVSDVAHILNGMITNDSLQVVGIVDPHYVGEEFHNIPVLDLTGFDKLQWDVVVITTLENLEQSEAQLHSLGISTKVIRTLS
jgi:DNA-binding MarR family transcriptional regulator